MFTFTMSRSINSYLRLQQLNSTGRSTRLVLEQGSSGTLLYAREPKDHIVRMEIMGPYGTGIVNKTDTLMLLP